MLASFVLPLVLTIVIETALARALLGAKDPHDLVTVVLVQVLTNPSVVLVAHLVGWYSTSTSVMAWVVMLLAESAAILVEAWVYRYDHTFRRPLAVSVVLNVTSFVAGLVIAGVRIVLAV